jgi:pilus assembly protein Flp/PilA
MGGMARFVARFLSDEAGATAIEYGLIAGLIALVIVGSATALGTALSTRYTAIGASIK